MVDYQDLPFRVTFRIPIVGVTIVLTSSFSTSRYVIHDA